MASEAEILKGTPFKDRNDLAEQIAELRLAMVTFRADEGSTEQDDRIRASLQIRLSEAMAKAREIGLTETEIYQGRQRGDERAQRIRHRCQMVRRTAEALANLGHSSLSDSEIDAMKSDPTFAAEVEAMAQHIREEKKP